MPFDYKKEYKEFYMPKNKPSIIEIPKMNYIAVRGAGNPNEENGDYQNTIDLIDGVYGILGVIISLIYLLFIDKNGFDN